MDDDEMVREIAEKMLSHFGYKITAVADGSEAIAAYGKAMAMGETYVAVIMDLTVPGGMGGEEAVVEILELDPQAKVIVSSGYSNDPVMTNYQDFGFSGVINKPFQVHELLEVVT